MPYSAQNRRMLAQRRHHRVTLSRDIVTSPGLKAIDLSESGLGVETMQALKIGSVIPLELKLDGLELGVQAQVMRCAPSQSIFKNCNIAGLMFVNVPPSDTIKIRRFIEQLVAKE